MTKLLHIQFLRGLAALSVAFLHAQHDASSLAGRAGDTFTPFTRFPFMAGVDVFFVISGFIMVYASRPMFGQPAARSDFLQRRIARIAPLYWTVTTLYLAIALAAPFLLNQPSPSAWMVLASYLFIPATRPDGLVQPVYSLGWTLNYEMFFYALFALVIALPLKPALVRLIAMLLGLVAVGSILRLPQPLAFWADPIILEFALGAGLGWLQSRGMTLGRPVRWALALLGLALLTSGGMAAMGGPFVRLITWGLPAALLVAAAALRAERVEPVSPFTRFCASLGDVSYAIYLIHPFVIRGAGEIAARTGIFAVIGPIGFLFIAMAATLAAAWAVHRAFERPAMSFMRRRLERAAST